MQHTYHYLGVLNAILQLLIMAALSAERFTNDVAEVAFSRGGGGEVKVLRESPAMLQAFPAPERVHEHSLSQSSAHL